MRDELSLNLNIRTLLGMFEISNTPNRPTFHIMLLDQTIFSHPGNIVEKLNFYSNTWWTSIFAAKNSRDWSSKPLCIFNALRSQDLFRKAAGYRFYFYFPIPESVT